VVLLDNFFSGQCRALYTTQFFLVLFTKSPFKFYIVFVPTNGSTLFYNLRENNITVENNRHGPSLQRENDFFIMEYCVNAGTRMKDLIKINLCRLYLGVTLASDIISGCGQYIMDWVWEGHRSPFAPTPKIRYSRPNTKIWCTWRTMLRKVFRCGRGHQLDKWLVPRSPENWYCFTHRLEYRGYVKQQDNSWLVYPLPRRFRLGHNIKLPHPYDRCETDMLPPDLLPASIVLIRKQRWLARSTSHRTAPNASRAKY